MIKSKRGRKPKIKPPEDLSNNIVENTAHEVTQVTNLPKKRGIKNKKKKIFSIVGFTLLMFLVIFLSVFPCLAIKK